MKTIVIESVKEFVELLPEGHEIYIVYKVGRKSITFKGLVRLEGQFRVQLDWPVYVDVEDLECELHAFFLNDKVHSKLICSCMVNKKIVCPHETYCFFQDNQEYQGLEPTVENAIKRLKQITEIEEVFFESKEV